MADQFKLKAWVRIDGTGKVIPGGPIFQANKPKVGKWRQLNTNLCCNVTPTTTTTTTAVTPTQFSKGYWLSEFDSCNTTTAGTLVFYSASTSIQAGITVFQDEALTIPVTEGYVVMGNDPMGNPFLVGAGGLLSVRECTTTTTTTTAYTGTYYVAGPTTEVCGGTGPYSLPLVIDPNVCSNGIITLAFGTYSDFGVPNGSTIYVNLQNGNVIEIQVFGSSQMSYGCTSCG